MVELITQGTWMTHQQMIIDTHFHIWNTDLFDMPWLTLFEGKLKKKYELNDYFKAISQFNIIQSCYEEIDTIKEQHRQEAEMIIGLCHDKTNQIMRATIATDLSSTHFKDYMQSFGKERVIKSVRHNFFNADSELTYEPTFRNNVCLLRQWGIMCDLVMPVDKILLGVDLVQACSNTRFVINHCGVCPILADRNTKIYWRKGMTEYAKQDNVLCKISECGFTNSDYPWQISDVVDIIEHCIYSFGEDRIVYGSNWPVCEMTAAILHWLEAIEVSLRGFPKRYGNKLFYENALKYYQLQ